jgi:Holliday junction resolvasome RuvABC endonuclease subunit
VKILGIDGGFANFGWCLATFENDVLHVDDMGVICTQKSKQAIPASVDNLQRAQKIAEALETLVLKFNPDDQRTDVQVDCICSEAMSFPPHASTAAKLSLSWGILATVSYMTRLPVLQRTPAAIKLAATGSRKASKAAMKESLVESHPEIRALLAPWPDKKHEHMVDALGAIVACLDDSVVRMGVRMSR